MSFEGTFDCFFFTTKECSEIGKDALAAGGSAVDAAVATLFCLGLLHMHNSGIGGGGFMNVYVGDQNKNFIYDFRETAPGVSTRDMFVNASSSTGNILQKIIQKYIVCAIAAHPMLLFGYT